MKSKEYTIDPRMLAANERSALADFLKSTGTIGDAFETRIECETYQILPLGVYVYKLPRVCGRFERIVQRQLIRSSICDSECDAVSICQSQIEDKDRLGFLVTTEELDVVALISLQGILDEEGCLIIDSYIDTDMTKPDVSSAIASVAKWASEVMYIESIAYDAYDKTDREINLFLEAGFRFQGEDNWLYFEDSLDPSNLEGPILTAGPSISQFESVYALDAARHGWNSKWSGYLAEFERQFAKYIGVKYSLATSSCTGALQIALMALGVKEGDEVIVPDQTWVASANAIRYVGAKPIFADVSLDDWTLSVQSVEEKITPRTKAIIPVHMYGHPADMTEIMKLAKKYNLFVVEDAAPSIGATHRGNKTGSFGHFSAFSFQGAKMLVTGEGGMLLTDDEVLFAKAKKIWDQGRNPSHSKAFWIDEKGVKFKMSNVQAAIGLGQLQRIETMVAQKRRIFRWYKEFLMDNRAFKLVNERADNRAIYWMTCLFITEDSRVSRDRLASLLKEDLIDTRPAFPAISQYPIWDEDCVSPQSNALKIGENGINLPSGVCLTRSRVRYICDRINFHLS